MEHGRGLTEYHRGLLAGVGRQYRLWADLSPLNMRGIEVALSDGSAERLRQRAHEDQQPPGVDSEKVCCPVEGGLT